MARNPYIVSIVRAFLPNYLNFGQRTGNMQYWQFISFVLLCVAVIIVFYRYDYWFADITAIVIAALLTCPTLAITVRRLHDTNRSGWVMIKAALTTASGATIIYLGYTHTTGVYNYFPQSGAAVLITLGCAIILTTIGRLVYILTRPSYPTGTRWGWRQR